MIREHHAKVLERWYQLYAIHFSGTATLSQHEFCALYGHDFVQTVAHLLEGYMDRFVMAMRASGESLVERGVPFREVISSLHLFEESCSVVFDHQSVSEGNAPRKRSQSENRLPRRTGGTCSKLRWWSSSLLLLYAEP